MDEKKLKFRQPVNSERMSIFSVFKCLVFCCLMVAGLAVADEASDTRKKIDQLRQEIVKLTEWMAKAGEDASVLEKKLKELEKNISSNRVEIETLDQQMTMLEKKQEDLRGHAVSLTAEIASQRERVEQILIGLYKAGGHQGLKLLLDQPDPQYWSRMLRYARVLGRYQQAVLQRYVLQLWELDQVRSELAGNLEDQRMTRARLAVKQRELISQKTDRSQVLASLKKEVKSTGERVESLKGDRARLEGLLNKMAEAIVNLVPSDISRPFSSVKGTLNWPVSGKVLQNYGGQIGRGPMKSQGLVIDVPADTVVKSVYHGRVVFADWLNGYGLMVIVDHGEGYMSLYARNEVLMRSVGEWVNRGDTIARSGDTGLRETGLYFEIRRQGQPQNPRLWLARK